MRAHQRQILRHAFLLLFLCALLSWNVAVGYAQDNGPKRGFQAGGSFALSDIESINTTNGNMMMHFPLASLPVGRGGLSASINLIYNSKLYNSHTSWNEDHYSGKFGCPPEGCFYQTDQLGFTNDGGWNYMMSYWLEVIDRGMDGSIDPTLHCADGIYVSSGYLPRTYVYKLKMHFPDGSVHELRPSGFSDLNPDDPLGDYYNIRPDGWIEDCFQGGHWSTASTLTYYSTDSTYLRLDIQQASHSGWWNDPWTLYLPDGSHVTGGNAPQRIYDRNNNYVEITNVGSYQGTGHPASVLTDQLGRSVAVENNRAATGEDWIHVQGFGEELVTKVHWNTASVGKTYWPCPEAGGMSCQTHDGGQQQTPDNLFVGLYVVDRITLPAQAGNLSYTFNYNTPFGGSWPPAPSSGWGELTGVTLPSGAQATYQFYQDGDPNGILSTPDVLQNYPTAKHLVYRPEYDGVMVSNAPCNPQTENCITENWSYSTADNGGGGTVTSPDGGVSTDYAIATNYSVSWQAWNVGMVYKSVHPDGSKTERIWAKNKLGDYSSYESMRGDNPYVKTEFTSIKNAAGTYVKTAIKDYNYDKNGNVTSVREYDWVDYASVPRDSNGNPTGIPSGAVPTRVTTNSYYASTPDASQSPVGNNVYWFQSSPLLKNAVASSELSDGSGNIRSRTELTYDYPLTKGNLIQKTTWDSTKGAYSNPLTTGNSISTYSQYNQYGSPTQTTDARGTLTVLTYGNIGGVTDLYPTQTVTASGTSIARTGTRSYDFATGLVTSATDADNNVTTSTSHDVFGRPTLVKAADGKPQETRTRTEYDDTVRRVIVHSDLNSLGDEKLVSIQHYDQLGRTRLSRQLEDSTTQSATDETTGIKVQTRYLFSGSNSYSLSSNPYRAAYSNQASEGTMGWARSKSDNSGRVIEVQTFGGSGLPAPWGGNTTSTGTVTTAYDANFTTVTDQALRMRRSMTNGLGQLARADEPGDPNTNNSLGTTDNPAQPTSYTYDALGNLVTVSQGSQTRTFTYSSLARLLTATNPESATICYGTIVNGQCQANGYDENGNLVYKTDARGVQTSYVYDRLNRATSRTYSDGTPAVTYTYDNPTTGANGMGRLWSTQTAANTLVTIDSYDALGRPKSQGQQFYYNNTWTQPYSITSITYDRAGHLLSETYPSGRFVTNTFDNAGRLNTFVGNLGDGTTRTYSTGITYASAGQMAQEQFGTDAPIYNKLAYNTRGQLSELRASTAGGDDSFNRGKIVNDYSDQCSGAACNGTDNNGNLKKQTMFIPNEQNTSWTSWNQQYGYDSLNRLTQVHEYTGNTQLDWQQAYNYDRFGNRLLNNNGSATWGQGINNVVAAIDTNTNRMYATNDPSHNFVDYDAAGNQTKDYLTSNGTRVYDAENRMTSATDSSYHASTYTYDGDGHRVRRNIVGTETWQVYGLGGELLAEYAANTAPSNPQKEYGYRNGQLLITATAPAGLAANTSSDKNTTAVATTSPASGTESRTTAQTFDLLASIKGLVLRLPGISTDTSASTEAVSDSSTPLFGPSLPYASLNRSAIPLMPQSGSAQIAFASNRDGSAQIYCMNTDGSALSRLTNDAANDEAPNWSPNNSRIVFQSDRDNLFSGIADIYVMNWDGSGQTRLTSDPADDSAPVWSPDGTKIAFQSARNGVSYQVYVMNADGSGQVNISNSAANDNQPSWSPDGSKIAFASDRDQAGFSSVYVMNANGTSQTRLTVSGAGLLDQQPVWSPDSSKLTFTSTRDGLVQTWTETDDNGNTVTKSALQVNKEVYVMNANGSAQVRLTNTLENDDSASWSGDGTKIVFRSDRERDCCDPTEQVWLMNSDGTSQVDLSNNGLADHCPSWQHVVSNIPPTVSLTRPANGATFTAPANITVTANASDSDGSISRVDFYQGTTLIGASTTSPYTISWSNVAAGSYTLTARATDNLGASTTSNPVNITVGSPPMVSVATPTNGATFTAPTNVSITANASASNGSINRVDFYQGTALIGTSTASPYTITWNNVTAGSYSLTAKATDNQGAATTSNAISITVNPPPAVADIRWIVTDQLGTPRMIFDQTGSLANVSRHDYLPFGEELTAGGRTTALGYGAGDGARQKFTQKERDNETGLDYFGARYYGSGQGRFISADPLLSSGRPSNPQAWNKYSYTLGNPLKFVDPDGLFEWDATLRDDPSLSDKERKHRAQLRDGFTNARNKAEADAAKAYAAGKLSDKKFKEINDALNAYGAENKANGVTVGVGTPNGEPGSTDSSFAINENWNGVTPKIAVKFDAGLLMSGSAEIGVAHEGTHVEDAFLYANNYLEITRGTASTDPRNMTRWDTENHAFHVQSYLFEAMGKNDDRWGTWQTKWAKLDAQQQEGKRQEASSKIIQDAYKLTTENKGGRYSEASCRPCK